METNEAEDGDEVVSKKRPKLIKRFLPHLLMDPVDPKWSFAELHCILNNSINNTGPSVVKSFMDSPICKTGFDVELINVDVTAQLCALSPIIHKDVPIYLTHRISVEEESGSSETLQHPPKEPEVSSIVDQQANPDDPVAAVKPLERNRPGPKPKDSHIDIETALIAKRNEIVLKNGKVVSKTDGIWAKIKTDGKLSSSTLSLYSYVVCNRGNNIQEKLGIFNENRLRNETVVISDDTTDDVENTDTEETGNEETKNMSRELFIPKDKWIAMKPSEVTYKLNDPDRPERVRSYLSLTPGVWCMILNNSITAATQLPCSWTFKPHYIASTNDAQYYLRAKGTCKCGGKVTITSPNPPPSDPEIYGIKLACEITGAKMESHKTVRKRPIRGEARMQIANRMVDQGVTASLIRKELAGKHCHMFGIEPSVLPKLGTLRQIKSQVVSQQKLDPDEIAAIRILKYTSNFGQAIQDVGDDPFFVHYLTAEQMRVYNAYAELGYSRIILDSSGKVVHKIVRPEGVSAHIFIYNIVISLPGEHEGQIPIYQMLSERQHTNAICFWLMEWLRKGATMPQEIVIDYSPALLLSVCKVFGHSQTRDEYINRCFDYLQKPQACPRPSALIRLDVAHLVSMVCKWGCVRSMRRRSKEFFVRSSYLVILADTLEAATSIIRAIFIVASNETEGIGLHTEEPTPCEYQKQFLYKLISSDKAARERIDSAIEQIIEEDLDLSEQDLEEEKIPSNGNIQKWVNDVFKECTSPQNIVEGDRDNLMFSTEFRTKFLNLCYKLPLWSNIMARAMQSPYEHAVGAHVESQFNDLFTRLITERHRVDTFLQKHIEILRNTMTLSTNLEFFRNKNKKTNSGLIKEQGTMNTVNEVINDEDNGALITGTECKDPKSNDSTLPISNVTPTDNDKNNNSTSEACFACASGNFPTPGGAHKCEKCHKPVHAISGCSEPAPGSEEGYGQKRICLTCANAGKLIDNSKPLANNLIKFGSPIMPYDSKKRKLPSNFDDSPSCKTIKPDNEGSEGCNQPKAGGSPVFKTCTKNRRFTKGSLALSSGIRQPNFSQINKLGTSIKEKFEAIINGGSPVKGLSGNVKDTTESDGRASKPAVEGNPKNAKDAKDSDARPSKPAVQGNPKYAKAGKDSDGSASKPAAEGNPKNAKAGKDSDGSASKPAAEGNAKDAKDSDGMARKPAVQESTCILCARDSPFEGRCVRCKKETHAIDTCSKLMPGNDGVNGTDRICLACFALFPSQAAFDMWLFENWKGLGVTGPKRHQGYYAKPYPELSLRVSNVMSCRLSPMQNGGTIKASVPRLRGFTISLTNTCGTDALLHLCATAYLDSQHFRSIADGSHASKFLSLVTKICKEGTDAAAYTLRAEMLHEALAGDQSLGLFNVCYIDSARTPDSLLAALKLPPSLIDNAVCSSPHCPRGQLRQVPFVVAHSKVLTDGGIRQLEQAVAVNLSGVLEMSPCLVPFTADKLAHVPAEGKTNDPPDLTLSPHVLCSGSVKHNYTVQDTVFISIAGDQSKAFSADDLASTEDFLQCKLAEIPSTLLLNNSFRVLRGIIAARAPAAKKKSFKAAGLTHYVTYSRRVGGKWELYDDLKKKHEPAHDRTIVYLVMALYTVLD